MPDLADGETTFVQGSAEKPYELKNTGGTYTCTCPAWRNQGLPPEQRTCKHLKKLRGEAAEKARIEAAGGSPGAAPARVPKLKKAAAVKSAPRGDGGDDEEGEGEGAEVEAAEGAEEEEDEGAPVLLAERWDSVRDLAGWWLSEKLDGVRAYWDGKAFYSRLGNAFHVPEWFAKGLPETPLDGELWGGRKRFQETVSIVRRQDKGETWRTIEFVVFDAPAMDAIFEARQAHIRRWHSTTRPPHARILEQAQCEGVDHLRAELARVEKLGGEGLMLREPGSRYVVGRSSTLLKVKSFFDTEARVVGHVPGLGRHKGRLGAVLAELPDGTRFNVGTGFSDAERAAPPPIGATITFRYQELTSKGVPRFPSYVGIRDDVKLPAAAAKSPAPPPAPPPPPPRAPAPAPSPAPKTAPVHVHGAAGKTETTGGTAMARRFEFTEDGAAKFWEISIDGASFTVRFGKIGAAGQAKTKTLASAAAASAEAAKLVLEKTGKGYEEVTPGAALDDEDADEDEDEDEKPVVRSAKAPAPPPPPRPAPAPAPSPAPAPASSGSRRFECTEDGAAKFWEVSIDGASFTVRYGKIGTAGQAKTKTLASAAAASAEAAKLVLEKTGKGYEEVPSGAVDDEDADEGEDEDEDEDERPVARSVKAPAPPPPPRPAPAPAPSPAPASSGSRRFECTEDGASKFWEVSIDGASFTVRYGKIGTAGQAKTKTLASAAAASAEAAKLVLEKTGKGYAEVTPGAAPDEDDDEDEDEDSDD